VIMTVVSGGNSVNEGDIASMGVTTDICCQVQFERASISHLK
jgi:hypothetical protein